MFGRIIADIEVFRLESCVHLQSLVRLEMQTLLRKYSYLAPNRILHRRVAGRACHSYTRITEQRGDHSSPHRATFLLLLALSFSARLPSSSARPRCFLAHKCVLFSKSSSSMHRTSKTRLRGGTSVPESFSADHDAVTARSPATQVPSLAYSPM